jgi:soluble lytic murein transglycosylase-like protein
MEEHPVKTPSVSGLIVALVATVLLFQTLPATAEIYKYEDRSGNLYFTDSPMKGVSYTLLWRSGNDPRFGSYSRIDIAGMKQNRKRLSPLIDRVARREQVHPGLLHAVVRAESAYDSRALSRKGAQGLMQLMPATARRFGVRDSWDPEQNLVGGARYLKILKKMFDDDLELVLAAYNAGENAVRKYGNQIPPFPETRDYVRKVISLLGNS